MPAAWQQSRQSGRAMRLVLGVALVLAVSLLIWRASVAVDARNGAKPGPPTNQAEYILEPLVGAGNVRVSRGGSPASVLVLLDVSGAATSSLTTNDIGSILADAGIYAPLAGETLTVRRVVFARPDGTDLAIFAELGGLVTLCLLLAGTLALGAGAPVMQANGPTSSQPVGVEQAPERVRPGHDPETVISLVRGWLREDAA